MTTKAPSLRHLARTLLALVPLVAGSAAYGQDEAGRLDGQPCSEEGARREVVIQVRGEDHTLHYTCRMDYRRNQQVWMQALRR